MRWRHMTVDLDQGHVEVWTVALNYCLHTDIAKKQRNMQIFSNRGIVTIKSALLNHASRRRA